MTAFITAATKSSFLLNSRSSILPNNISTKRSCIQESTPRQSSRRARYNHNINIVCQQQRQQQQAGEMQRDPIELNPGVAQKVIIEGRQLSYDYVEGSGPTIVFLPGYFFSRWDQAKANSMENFAKRNGQSILVEEYLGTGNSSGDFAKDGTLSQWISDTTALIDRLPSKDKVILVGAGVGGWIMLHVAMHRPGRVIGLVGINPSVDFTHDLIAPSMTSEQRDELEKEGVVSIQWGHVIYPISKALLQDAEKWLVLQDDESNSLDITCPVRFIQGLSDEEIPQSRILRLVNSLKTNDCVMTFIKNGNHLLEEEQDMRRQWDAVCEISSSFYEYDLTSPGSG